MNHAYINHLMCCKACYAPANRYCANGRKIKIESDAEYHASELLKIPTSEARRRYMDLHTKNYFDVDSLHEAVKKRFILYRAESRAAA